MKKLAAVLLLAVIALGFTGAVKAATTSCCDPRSVVLPVMGARGKSGS